MPLYNSFKLLINKKKKKACKGISPLRNTLTITRKFSQCVKSYLWASTMWWFTQLLSACVSHLLKPWTRKCIGDNDAIPHGIHAMEQLVISFLLLSSYQSLMQGRFILSVKKASNSKLSITVLCSIPSLIVYCQIFSSMLFYIFLFTRGDSEQASSL